MIISENRKAISVNITNKANITANVKIVANTSFDPMFEYPIAAEIGPANPVAKVNINTKDDNLSEIGVILFSEINRTRYILTL